MTPCLHDAAPHSSSAGSSPRQTPSAAVAEELAQAGRLSAQRLSTSARPPSDPMIPHNEKTPTRM
jgi:hypothetical protein